MEQRFRQKVVLVTGGSSGIGLSTARRFGREGASVMLLDADREGLERAVTDLGAERVAVVGEEGSVGTECDVQRAVRRAERELGPIDVLISNAGVGPEGLVVETSVKQWDAIYETNVRGAFVCSREVARRMIEHGRGGVILMTSSINAVMPVPHSVAYASSKAALDTFMRGLAMELAPTGIRVCGVSPGYTDTEMLRKVYSDGETLREWKRDRLNRIPLGRLARPEEIAGVFAFLASSGASYITGTNFVVDGGRLATQNS